MASLELKGRLAKIFKINKRGVLNKVERVAKNGIINKRGVPPIQNSRVNKSDNVEGPLEISHKIWFCTYYGLSITNHIHH